MRLRAGETEGHGWHVEDLTEVVDTLFDACSHVAGRPRIIAIDGRGGAGKTELANRMRAIVPSSAVVHTDHVAWNFSIFGWGDRLIDNILRPLHHGSAVDVDFRSPESPDPRQPGPIRIPAGLDVVWVEGVGVVREELAPWVDASIWVQGDLDEQERRMESRDGADPDHQRFYALWVAEELPFLQQERPWARATLVATNTVDIRHDPETQLIVAGLA